jgi:hypothetical protein
MGVRSETLFEQELSGYRLRIVTEKSGQLTLTVKGRGKHVTSLSLPSWALAEQSEGRTRATRSYELSFEDGFAVAEDAGSTSTGERRAVPTFQQVTEAVAHAIDDAGDDDVTVLRRRVREAIGQPFCDVRWTTPPAGHLASAVVRTFLFDGATLEGRAWYSGSKPSAGAVELTLHLPLPATAASPDQAEAALRDTLKRVPRQLFAEKNPQGVITHLRRAVQWAYVRIEPPRPRKVFVRSRNHKSSAVEIFVQEDLRITPMIGAEARDPQTEARSTSWHLTDIFVALALNPDVAVDDVDEMARYARQVLRGAIASYTGTWERRRFRAFFDFCLRARLSDGGPNKKAEIPTKTPTRLFGEAIRHQARRHGNQVVQAWLHESADSLAGSVRLTRMIRSVLQGADPSAGMPENWWRSGDLWADPELIVLVKQLSEALAVHHGDKAVEAASVPDLNAWIDQLLNTPPTSDRVLELLDDHLLKRRGELMGAMAQRVGFKRRQGDADALPKTGAGSGPAAAFVEHQARWFAGHCVRSECRVTHETVRTRWLSQTALGDDTDWVQSTKLPLTLVNWFGHEFGFPEDIFMARPLHDMEWADVGEVLGLSEWEAFTKAHDPNLDWVVNTRLSGATRIVDYVAPLYAATGKALHDRVLDAVDEMPRFALPARSGRWASRKEKDRKLVKRRVSDRLGGPRAPQRWKELDRKARIEIAAWLGRKQLWGSVE